jgi:CheY-like chemotaxis protein
MYNLWTPDFVLYLSRAQWSDHRAFVVSETFAAGGQVSKTNPQISVIDDDESMREAMRGLMKSLGFTAQTFASAEEFLNSCQVPRTSCLITDVQMRGTTGLELHRHLVASGKTIPTILITAYPDDTVRKRALGDGVVCYLSKPFDENDLLAYIRSSLNIWPEERVFMAEVVGWRAGSASAWAGLEDIAGHCEPCRLVAHNGHLVRWQDAEAMVVPAHAFAAIQTLASHPPDCST